MSKCQSVLYVDDDVDICEVVQTTLRLLAGLEVQTAHSGARAIDLAYELRPDLIILDVMMPGLDGPSTYERMRSSAVLADIPVIFMTAKVLPTEIARLLRLGAIGVIRKPFDPLRLGGEVLALWNDAVATRTLTGAGEVQARVESLALNFLERVRGEVIRLRDLTASAGRGNRSALDEIERLAHSVHGAGAIFGFPLVSAAGGNLERRADELLTRGISVGEAAEPLDLQLQQYTERLAQEVEAAAASGLQRARVA